MSELAGTAAGGHVLDVLGDFNIASAVELEAHVNIRAIAARRNFDKYYAERLTDVSKLWTDQKRRLDIRQPFEVPTITIDVGAPKFDFQAIPKLFADAEFERAESRRERELRKEHGETSADLEVDQRISQDEPLKLKLIHVDYTNLDKVVLALTTGGCTAKRLDLSNSGFTAEEAGDLARLLELNKSITTLDLSGNEINNEGIEKLVGGLAQNRTLTDLDVSCAAISKTGMAHLAKVIASPDCVLQRLHLAGNKLGIYGGEILAEALVKNTSVKALGIQNNNIGNDGLEKFRDVTFGGEAALALAAKELAGEKPSDEEGAPPSSSWNRTIVMLGLDNNRASDDLVLTLGRLVGANEARVARQQLIDLESSERAIREREFAGEFDEIGTLVRKSLAAVEAKLKADAEAAKPAGKTAAGSSGASKGAPAATATGKAKAPAAKPVAASGSKSPVKTAAAKAAPAAAAGKTAPAAKAPAKAAPAPPAAKPAAAVASSKAVAASSSAKRAPSPKKATPTKK